MQKFNDCTITYNEDVDSLMFDWGTIHSLSDAHVTGSKSISFCSVAVEPGKGHSRHNHPDADEIIYVISGEGIQMLDDHDPVAVKPGACIWVPKGIYHSTLNTGAGTLQLVVAYIPAGSEQLLRTMEGVKIIPAGQH
jgi:oxalate decarboxylase/phosphoglucose isomerase-like protein (cupin superfamily)